MAASDFAPPQRIAECPDAGVHDVPDVNVFEPLHLLKPSADHQSLVINSEAQSRLAAIGPVAVLSVVGNQRGGKSTLMNLLHGRRLQGFQTGHYMDPQTFGVWAWPRPHPRRPGLTVLLIDSEGLDSPHVPQHYNWLISAIAVLISDVFMYQTRGSIESSSAERLDMILSVAEQLRGGGDNADEVSKSVFWWLLRDHQLQMKHSPKDELVEKLDPGQIRALRRSFSDYDCIPLPRPANDDILRAIDRHQFEDLSENFREEFVVFERRLLELLSKPREIFGGSLTGGGLMDLLKQYLGALDQRKGILGDICQMPTQRELLKELACKRMLETSVQTYQRHMQGPDLVMPVAPLTLFRKHEEARIAAMNALENQKDACLEKEDLKALRQRLDDELASWCVEPHVAKLKPGVEQSSAPSSVSFDAGNIAAIIENSALCTVPPVVTQISQLKEGLLWRLWQTNAQNSLSAYLVLLKRLSNLKTETMRSAEPTATKTAEVVTALYASLRGLLQEAAGDALGPWATGLLAGGAKEDSVDMLVLQISQQGDELVADFLESVLAHRLVEVNDCIEEHRSAVRTEIDSLAHELRNSLQEVAEKLRGEMNEQVQSSVGEAHTELTNAINELKMHTKEAVSSIRDEIKESQKQATAEARLLVDEGLELTQAAVRSALQELEVKTSQAHAQEAVRVDSLLQGEEARASEMTTQAISAAVECLRAEKKTSEDELRSTLETNDARMGSLVRDWEVTLRTHIDEVAKQCEQKSCESLQLALATLQEAIGKESSNILTLENRFTEKLASLESTSRDIQEQLGQHVAAVGETNTAELEARCTSEVATAIAAAGRATSFVESEVARLQYVVDSISRRSDESSGRVLEDAREAARCACDGLREEIGSEIAAEIAAGKERELDTRAHLEETCTKLLEDGSKRTLSLVRKALDVVEEKILGERLAPIENGLREVAIDLDALKSEHQAQREAMAKNDMNAIWESFAHLAQQLAAMQINLDNLIVKDASKAK